MEYSVDVYVSNNGLDFEKLDLNKSEPILMKFVLKDTSDLSKVFAPFSQSFTIPATLKNQKAFGFIGKTEVYKSKTDNVFDSKIYVNGFLSQTGKIKITDMAEVNGRIENYTGNFTTSMQSLKDRIGDTLISDLADNNVVIEYSANNVINAIRNPANMPPPATGFNDSKFFVPLISKNRVWQVRDRRDGVNYLDNVSYDAGLSPTSTNCIKTSELRPAIQGKTIIDLIKKRFNLSVIMPLENEQHYKDWYFWCNAEQSADLSTKTLKITDEAYSYNIGYQDDDIGGDGIPPNPRYEYSFNSSNDTVNIHIKNNFSITSFNVSSRWDTIRYFEVNFTGFQILDEVENSEVTVSFVRTDGRVLKTETKTISTGSNETFRMDFDDSIFLGNDLSFNIKINSKTQISWVSSDFKEMQEYNHNFKVLGVTHEEIRQFIGGSTNAWNNSTVTGLNGFDLFKTLPNFKVIDFLTSFFKTFNISVFDVSPNDENLYWLTNKDIESYNNDFSKKEVDYTDRLVDSKVTKKATNEYTYYNLKHATSKYYSAVSYKNGRGYEFGQLTYPTVKPVTDLKEYKIETSFSLVEAVPFSGVPNGLTSYGFDNSEPKVLAGGEKRYKPITNELTMFFLSNSVDLVNNNAPNIAIQATDNVGNLIVEKLNNYYNVSPIHPNGFSLGFSLIQEATQRSLYNDFYKELIERLLDVNVLEHSFNLELRASDLYLNYKLTSQGQSNVPDGFRLQNDIIINEKRYSIVDAEIDATTGKTKIKLLNY